MSTKNLSPAERLALQAGAVMQVYVTKIDGNDIQVSLKAPDKDINKDKRSMNRKNDGTDFDNPTALAASPRRSRDYISGSSSQVTELTINH